MRHWTESAIRREWGFFVAFAVLTVAEVAVMAFGSRSSFSWLFAAFMTLLVAFGVNGMVSVWRHIQWLKERGKETQ